MNPFCQSTLFCGLTIARIARFLRVKRKSYFAFIRTQVLCQFDSNEGIL